MIKLAKLASPLNWRHRSQARLPQFFLLTDMHRLPDPTDILTRLPRGAVVILRHPESGALENLARRIIGPAHRLGFKVLLAGEPQLALRLGADGVHLSARLARRGPLRFRRPTTDFLITAAAHSHLGLWRASRARADLSLLSPVFSTASHPGVQALGILRFLSLAACSPVKVVALGGVIQKNARRLRADKVLGLAAIGAWRD